MSSGELMSRSRDLMRNRLEIVARHFLAPKTPPQPCLHSPSVEVSQEASVLVPLLRSSLHGELHSALSHPVASIIQSCSSLTIVLSSQKTWTPLCSMPESLETSLQRCSSLPGVPAVLDCNVFEFLLSLSLRRSFHIQF